MDSDVVKDGKSDIHNVFIPYDPIHKFVKKEYKKIDEKYEFLKALKKLEEEESL